MVDTSQQEASPEAQNRRPARSAPGLAARLARLKWAVETVNGVVQMIAIAAAGVWAFYTFIYEDRIKPAEETPVLVAEARLTPVGRRNEIVAVQAQMTLRNIGKVRLNLLARVVNVEGVRIDLRPGPLAPLPREQPPTFLYRTRNFRDGEREVLLASSYLYKAAGVGEQVTYLDPGEQVVAASTIVYVDRRRFDQVQASYSIDYVRKRPTPYPTTIVTGSRGELSVRTDPCRDPQPLCAVNTDVQAVLSLW